MNYKLKSVNGKVTFLLRTCKDFGKNQMAVASAQHIIETGKLKKSTKEGYPHQHRQQVVFRGRDLQDPRTQGRGGR